MSILWVLFLKIQGHENKNKNAFSSVYACLLKKKVGFLTTLTTSGRNRSSPNWKQVIIPIFQLFVFPEESSLLPVVVTVTKREPLNFKVEMPALLIIINHGRSPFLQRCAKAFHRTRNYRTPTCSTPSLSSSESLFMAAFRRLSWI